MVDLLTALIWLHYEAAPVVDSATQRLLEENNQFLNQIAANIEIFKVCIQLGLSCLEPKLTTFTLNGCHMVYGACKYSNLNMAVSYTVHTY